LKKENGIAAAHDEKKWQRTIPEGTHETPDGSIMPDADMPDVMGCKK
jgi:hypothetical protein